MTDKHLDLLRAEHLALQNRYAQLKKRFDIACASSKENNNSQSSFVESLVSAVAELYDKELYRLEKLFLTAFFLFSVFSLVLKVKPEDDFCYDYSDCS